MVVALLHPAAAARERMVARQIQARGVRDARVLAAMRAVPRERFVDRGDEARAYDDRALPIAGGQTISQPYIVARMFELAALQPHEHLLEVGTGSGYAAAVASRLAARVCTVERLAVLAASAARRIDGLGLRNVDVRVADGSQGWPDAAPFDAIIVAAGAPAVPAALKDQLAEGGRLVMPVGPITSQQLVGLTRCGDRFDSVAADAVRFVPLVPG